MQLGYLWHQTMSTKCWLSNMRIGWSSPEILDSCWQRHSTHRQLRRHRIRNRILAELSSRLLSMPLLWGRQPPLKGPVAGCSEDPFDTGPPPTHTLQRIEVRQEEDMGQAGNLQGLQLRLCRLR